MKLVPLENYSSGRIAIGQVRSADGLPFSVNPGCVVYVTPAVAAHPSIQRFMGAGLREKGQESSVTPPPEPVQPEKPVTVEKPEPKNVEKVDVRELFLSAPGITENNIEDVLDMFPSVDDLADASKEDLLEVGVSKSFVSRLLDWAKNT